MKKKVGIVTFWFADNVGALLQNYALQSAIEKMGFESQTLAFRHPVIKHNIVIRALVTCKHLIYGNSNQPKSSNVNKSIFESFRKNYIHLTTKFEISDLNEKEFDYYITGSDQVWNVNNIVKKPLSNIYFLKFTRNEKKIAYAASIGYSTISAKEQKALKKNIENFNGISVREFSAQRILKEVCNAQYPVLLDPVFLTKSFEWNKLITPTDVKQDYILCYFLGLTEENKKYLETISQQYGCELLFLSTNTMGKENDYCINDIGQFLGLIHNAKLVCTDSFHGTAFSIIFNKDFYCFKRNENDGMRDMTDRMNSVLRKLNLEDRWYDKDKKLCHIAKTKYEEVNNLIDLESKKSIDFLKSKMF